MRRHAPHAAFARPAWDPDAVALLPRAQRGGADGGDAAAARGGRALARVWEELADWPWPAVAFESPRRLPATLRSLAAVEPNRRLAVCRELTKRHEQIVRGRAEELSEQFVEAPKGEITLVLGPGAEQQPADAADAAQAVAELVAAGLARRQAAAVVARLTGVSRKQLYDASL